MINDILDFSRIEANHIELNIKTFGLRNFIESTVNPHSARNGRGKTIKKQVQVADSSVGRQEKRNLKCEDEEPTN